MEQLSKIQIIEETVAYYSEDPKNRRGLSNYGCVYQSSDGKQCAVGRCLINPAELERMVREDELSSGAIDDIAREYDGDLQELFKPEYRNHSVFFWRELQELHDDTREDYWSSEGLTDSGKNYVERLKFKYKGE